MDTVNQARSPSLSSNLVHVGGMHCTPSNADVRQHISGGKYFWLDLCGFDPTEQTALLEQIGMSEADIAWVSRFGQVGRMSISHGSVRTVTFIATPPNGVVEVHLWASPIAVVTVWSGDPTILQDAREKFIERVGGVAKSHYLGAAIVLQLLLGTFEDALGFIDERIQTLHKQIRERPASVDIRDVSSRLEVLRDTWLKFDRFTGAVRSAVVGLDLIKGIDADGVRELKAFVDHVEDIESRIHERFQWGSDIIQDYTVALAQQQGDQISRLTAVSVVFLPLGFLTGFFGMNFNWMADHLTGGWEFAIYGIILPLVLAIVTLAWLWRLRILQSNKT